MSNFSSIDLAQLVNVVGGLEVSGHGRVQVGTGGGEVDVDGTYKRTPYESCVAAVTSRPNWQPDEIRSTCGEPR